MAWSEITRHKYRRDGLRYASHFTDAEWVRIEPLLPPSSPLGRPRATDMRSVLIHRVTMPILRFLDLIVRCLFERRCIAVIDKPPPVDPSRKRDRTSPNQMTLAYA